MKILKKLIVIIIIIVGIYFAISLLLPKTFFVERSIIIQAPVEKVFAEVNDFSNMDHWSPWKDYDPDMKPTIEGNPGEPGYKYSWSSDHKNVGHGSLTRVHSVENKSIENELFFEDFNMKSKVHFLLDETADGVKVTWQNSGDIALPLRIPMAAMNMEKQMSPDLEKGLARMKKYCEDQAAQEAALAAAADSVTMQADTLMH